MEHSRRNAYYLPPCFGSINKSVAPFRQTSVIRFLPQSGTMQSARNAVLLRCNKVGQADWHMRIPINRESIEPLYRQVESFLREQIQSGALAQDTRLPSSRELAEDLGVGRVVVATAYAELESHGLVYSRHGSGTFVAPLFSPSSRGFSSPQDWPLWQQELLSNTWQPAYTEFARSLDSATGPTTICFAEQMAPDALWPADDFRKVLNQVLRKQGVAAVGQGNGMAGYLPLRTTVAEILTADGIPAQPSNVIITSGSQQALALVAGLLLRHGDVVLVESPTYNVAIDLFRSRGVRLLGIPVDEEGMRVEQVEETLRSTHPRLIYTIPTFQNPSGACMSGTRRRQLVALADRYNIPILEDDFIGNLRFEGKAEPALKALDTGGHVVYVGTVSKVLMPALRIGFLVAHGPIYERLLLSKYVSDLATSDLMQRALTEYITVGRFRAHVRSVCQSNQRRRDVMIKALSRHLPPETRWLHPKGGRFLWLQLPHELSSNDLFPLASKEGVTFAPGSFFFPGERPQSYLRLNFAINPPEIIEEGIRRLGRAVTRLIEASKQSNGAQMAGYK